MINSTTVKRRASRRRHQDSLNHTHQGNKEESSLTINIDREIYDSLQTHTPEKAQRLRSGCPK